MSYRIIHGRRYDTDTASNLGSNEYETLYRKVTGEYFLVKDNSKEKEFTPLTLKAAEEWARKHFTTEDCDKIFNATSEKTQVSIRVDTEMKQRIDAIRKIKKPNSKKVYTFSDIIMTGVETIEAPDYAPGEMVASPLPERIQVATWVNMNLKQKIDGLEAAGLGLKYIVFIGVETLEARHSISS